MAGRFELSVVAVGVFILVIPTTSASDTIECAHCVNTASRVGTVLSDDNNNKFGSIMNVSIIRIIGRIVVAAVVVLLTTFDIVDIAVDGFGGYIISIRIG